MYVPSKAQVYIGEATSSDGSPLEVVAVIYSPVSYAQVGGLASIIRCPYLFRHDRLIVGVNPSETYANAAAFLRAQFDTHAIKPRDDNPIELSTYLDGGGLLPWDEADSDLDTSNPFFVPAWLPPAFVVPREQPVTELFGLGLNEDGSKKSTRAAAYHGRFDREAGCWGSIVECPAVFTHPKMIFGVDGAQAEELAERFLKEMLEHSGFEIAEVRHHRL
jgi:hypothetical protein